MNTIKINSRIVLPAVTLALGVLWVVYGLMEYGWWGDNGPKSGFFPAIVGTLLAVISVFAILGGLKNEKPAYLAASFHPVLGVIAVVLSSFLLGFFPALGLFVLGWIRFYEKYSWKTSLITSVITIAVFYGIFSLWLRVPFPEGIILDVLRG